MPNHPRQRASSARCWPRMRRSSHNICENPVVSPLTSLRRRTMRAVTMTSEARTLEALLRNDFRAFVHKVFATLAPGQTYFRTWHVEAIAWQLERVRRGEVR